ncbi:arylamine N-acetyltransferase [Paenibacillus sp. MWE-103]|uniref:Arylamine N-acetyltransferase n=1 Tax=Paenibacillus artemisiicola TaxID=1172618 RepID=A0ABS3W402_9BACL|nr:arylamine N-acetyltransferase [Paenibacillus artemisiicola]MBO7743032.1 arylamine N-acetyltransferase [Paenibacillus artemisiicola]
MDELDRLYRERIGMAADEPLEFAGLSRLLEKTAAAFPFENMRVLDGRACPITKPYLTNKLLLEKEGGLCYELNSLLYLFLAENGFRVVLASGVNYDREAQRYLTLGRSHIVVLLVYEERRYLLDAGFGANLPLTPVPLNGDAVDSPNGTFRIRPEDGIPGDCRLEVKIKHKDTEWQIGYAFDSGTPIAGLTVSEDIRRLVAEHPESKFNKRPLATKLTETGNITLTDDSFTEWRDGIVTKESIDGPRYRELLRTRFGLRP